MNQSNGRREQSDLQSSLPPPFFLFYFSTFTHTGIMSLYDFLKACVECPSSETGSGLPCDGMWLHYGPCNCGLMVFRTLPLIALWIERGCWEHHYPWDIFLPLNQQINILYHHQQLPGQKCPCWIPGVCVSKPVICNLEISCMCILPTHQVS